MASQRYSLDKRGTRPAPLICHLTVLNPAVHPRIYFKLALSQVKLGYRVTVIGQDPLLTPYHRRGVRIVPVKPFGRLSLHRIFSGWQLLRLCLRENPELVVLHTPELWWTGLLLKTFFGKKIVYDVHEDYASNARAGSSFPGPIKSLLAWGIRTTERGIVRIFDGISYAEECYDNILRAKDSQYVVLRNTFSEASEEGKSNLELPSLPYMLYTGTLAREWGVFETLSLWKKLNTEKNIPLIIAGFTHDAHILEELKSVIKESGLEERVTLIGGAQFVPYSDILHLIRHCWFGTALYAPLPHLREKVPTKFYEYQAMSRPLVFTSLPFWESLNSDSYLGLAFNPRETATSFLQRLSRWEEENYKSPKEAYSWENDEKKMAIWLKEVCFFTTNG